MVEVVGSGSLEDLAAASPPARTLHFKLGAELRVFLRGPFFEGLF